MKYLIAILLLVGTSCADDQVPFKVTSAAITGTTLTNLVSKPATRRIFVCSVLLTNSDPALGAGVDIQDGGTAFSHCEVSADKGVCGVSYTNCVPLTGALSVQSDTAVTSIKASVTGYYSN